MRYTAVDEFNTIDTNMTKNRAGRRYKNLTNKCEHCKGDFHPYLGRKNQRFCSDKCYRVASSPALESKLCPVCNEYFEVSRAHSDRYTVCSYKCRVANSYGHCLACGKAMTTKKGTVKYCSEACRRPPVYESCKHCGKRFRRIPSVDRSFCQFICYRKYKGETSLEATVRVALEELGLDFEQEVKVGRFFADFVLRDEKIIIEADGTYWHEPEKDRRRDHALEKYGWITIRLPEHEVNKSNDVMNYVISKLQS